MCTVSNFFLVFSLWVLPLKHIYYLNSYLHNCSYHPSPGNSCQFWIPAASRLVCLLSSPLAPYFFLNSVSRVILLKHKSNHVIPLLQISLSFPSHSEWNPRPYNHFSRPTLSPQSSLWCHLLNLSPFLILFQPYKLSFQASSLPGDSIQLKWCDMCLITY